MPRAAGSVVRKRSRASNICSLSLLTTVLRCLVGHLGLSGMHVLFVPSIVNRSMTTRGECLMVTLISILGLMLRRISSCVNRPVWLPSLAQSKCRLPQTSVSVLGAPRIRRLNNRRI